MTESDAVWVVTRGEAYESAWVVHVASTFSKAELWIQDEYIMSDFDKIPRNNESVLYRNGYSSILIEKIDVDGEQ